MTAADAPQVEPLRLTLEEARRRHDAASAELQRLCEGKRFRMSIPVQPDDSDVILGDALQALKALTEGHDLVPRDPAAELAEAAERHLWALNEVRQRDYSHKLAGTVAEKEAAWDALSHAKREAAEARKGLEAVLARVRGET